MFRNSLPIAVLLLVLATNPCFAAPPADTTAPDVTLPATAHASERIYNLPGLSNVGRVAPGVLRGAAPASGEGAGALGDRLVDPLLHPLRRRLVEARRPAPAMGR